MKVLTTRLMLKGMLRREWNNSQLMLPAIAIHYPHEFPQQLTEPKIKEKLKTARFGLKVIVAEDISGTLYEYFLGKGYLLNLENG